MAWCNSGKISTTDATADQPVKIQVAETPQKKVEIDSSRIVAMDRTSENFWQRFNGDISLGLIYSKGNQSTQYNLNSSVEYPRNRWGAAATLHSTLSSSSGADASTRNQLTLSSHRRLRWNNYFYSGFTDFLESTEQGISLQTSLGGGIGRYLKNTNRSRISVLGGLAWQRTRYDGSTVATGTQNVASGMIGANIKVLKFKKTSLNMSATLFPAISDPGRVYFRTNASYYIKLFSNVWNFTFYGN